MPVLGAFALVLRARARWAMERVTNPSSAVEPRTHGNVSRDVHGCGRIDMFKGGLLWLLGIPLPIILILFFLGYLH